MQGVGEGARCEGFYRESGMVLATGICSLPHLPVTPAGVEVAVGIEVEAKIEAGALYREHTDG